MENTKRLALGYWQQEILCRLLDGKEIVSPPSRVRGKAKLYQSRYFTSFYNLLDRIEKSGLVIERKVGVRGGEYTATYKLVR